ncbi:hypothetical protein [Sandaracinobacteroides hominis]|uniref:hypothetical protein n=1 Tax=Sandaracinobacteroides hominis TaxID=2780086 RepID=UPI002E2909EE|nr:hypothetical protein [Sandaracinobacteroides hominis]
MNGRARDDEPPEAVNREQEDEGQAQDVAEDALHPETGGGSVRGNHVDPTQILPDDVPDLVETMEHMVSSGRIDNDAYAGEPQHDDEEDMLGDTEDDDDDMLYNELADGSEDPLADPVDLSEIADTGDDPLGEVASEHGLEDEDSEDDDDDYDDADDDDLYGEDEE